MASMASMGGLNVDTGNIYVDFIFFEPVYCAELCWGQDDQAMQVISPLEEFSNWSPDKEVSATDRLPSSHSVSGCWQWRMLGKNRSNPHFGFGICRRLIYCFRLYFAKTVLSSQIVMMLAHSFSVFSTFDQLQTSYPPKLDGWRVLALTLPTR